MTITNSDRRSGARMRAARHGLAIAASLLLTTAGASAQVVNFYSGTNSAGKDVEIYTTAYGRGTVIYVFGLTGNKYCNGILVPGAVLGGNTDGTQFHPVINGRATFEELRPDYFIAADIQFSGTTATGTATFKQALFTGPDFPPKDVDASSCSTDKLTFTATYVGSETAPRWQASQVGRQAGQPAGK